MMQDSPPTDAGTTAPSKKKEDIQGAVQSSDFLLYSVVLAGILLLAATVFYFLERWRKSKPSGHTELEASTSLSTFRESYENGEMTEKEYLRIREKLASQMKTTGSTDLPLTRNPPAKREPEQPPSEPPPEKPHNPPS